VPLPPPRDPVLQFTTAHKKRPAYRFFFRRLFFVGTNEKLVEVRTAGIIGAALAVVLTLILPAGVSVVLVRMRMRFLPRVRFRVVRRAYPPRSGSKRQGTRQQPKPFVWTDDPVSRRKRVGQGS
jgi:hypothetical protein